MKTRLFWTWSVFVPIHGYHGLIAETEADARRFTRAHFGLRRLPRKTLTFRHRLVCIPAFAA